MTRCAVPSVAALLVALAATAPPADAQVNRVFPPTALRGSIAFGDSPPLITLNGQPAQLSPGSRIHGMDNMLKMTGALVGQKYMVDYTTEPASGLVQEVWLLTTAEAGVLPWPQTLKQAATWRFDPVAQTWTIP